MLAALPRVTIFPPPSRGCPGHTMGSHSLSLTARAHDWTGSSATIHFSLLVQDPTYSTCTVCSLYTHWDPQPGVLEVSQCLCKICHHYRTIDFNGCCMCLLDQHINEHILLQMLPQMSPFALQWVKSATKWSFV